MIYLLFFSYVLCDAIRYYGGSVLTGDVNVYMVYYGNWQQSSIDIVNGFVNSLTSTDYYNVQRTYYFGEPGGYIKVADYKVNDYAFGNEIDVFGVLNSHIENGDFPGHSENNIYVLMAYRDVAVAGHCAGYCAYHALTFAKYIFIGHPERCGGSCGGDPGINRDYDGDSVIALLTHEIVETLSDPYGDGWYGDNYSQENADLCAWNLGQTYTNENGGIWNIESYNGKYLVHANFDAEFQECSMGRPNKTTEASSSAVPFSSETLSSEIPSSTEVPMSSEIPSSTGVSMSSEIPSSTGVSMSSEIPSSTGVSMSSEIPSSTGVSMSSEIPSSTGVSMSSETETLSSFTIDQTSSSSTSTCTCKCKSTITSMSVSFSSSQADSFTPDQISSTSTVTCNFKPNTVAKQYLKPTYVVPSKESSAYEMPKGILSYLKVLLI